MEDRSILSILETLAQAADLPQRQIAADTGLNLAKVNFVLKKLVEKGHVKFKRVRGNPHKLRYLYLLTPEGLAEKSRLTYRFMRRTLDEYRQAEAAIGTSIERMLAAGIRRVVLWGQTDITDLCLRVLSAVDGKVHVVACVDPTGQRAAALSPKQLSALDFDAVIVCDPDSDGIPAGVKVWRLA